jgi:thiosulfate dehydrogenase (quinone) large subunit
MAMAQLASQLGHQSSNPDAALAYGVLRLTVGLDCLFHSSTRWSHISLFADKVVSQFAGTPLPSWSVRVFANEITVWEPIVGGLLLCGFRTRDALVAGGLLIAALVFGTAVRGDFTVLTEQLVYALIFFVLLLYRRENDRWSVDQFIARRSIGAKA